MENFDQIFTLLANHENISLNTDILETGLINILVLIGILIFYSPTFLGSFLEERRTKIVDGVEDAENRLKEAQKRLTEVENKLNETYLVFKEIDYENESARIASAKLDASQAKKDVAIIFERALATIQSKERQIFLEIKQQMISIMLQKTVNRLQETFKSKKRATALINETINKLEGDLL